MDFKYFNNQIKNQFDIMCQTGKLFRSEITGQQVWDVYLSSFEDEKIFRDPESSEHNCNCCKNFIKRYGNIVAINADGNLTALFSGIVNVGEYSNSAIQCAKLLENSKIKDVFFETYNELNSNLNYESCKRNQETYKLGIEANFKKYTKEEADKFGVVNTTDVYEFNHFQIDLPKQFVNYGSKSIESIMAHYRDKYQVFKRAMEEIPLDTLNLVKDLINQGSLLDGTAHLHAIEQIIPLKRAYDSNQIKDNQLWVVSYQLEERIAKFKNTLIGVLCTELAEGMELNKACENWNKRVDPVNYHKATAPITKRQIEEAKKFVEENGYTESFNRRLATIDDIKASEILHMNAGDGKIEQVSVFDSVKPSSTTRHKRAEFDKVGEISIDKFMKDILPTATSVEAFLENKMEGNLVTMTKSISDEAKRITKWNNIATNYSWTFNGNLAGKSQIKEAVKSRGGNTEAIVRISLHFPDTTSDYDLHLKEPTNHVIYYNNVRRKSSLGGMLDLDAQGCDGYQAPEKRVENITYCNKAKMTPGNYKVMVNNYSGRSLHTTFTIEIEIEGDVTLLKFNNIKHANKKEEVVSINFDGDKFTINPCSNMDIIESKTISKELWKLETNKFHKVNLVCKSPNHWGDNQIGNLHYFFMLDKCKCESKVRGFHNENLTEDLLKHKKVMEVLGNSAMLKPTDKQLSGIGFNSTVKDELIVKVQGSHKRMLKIKF